MEDSLISCARKGIILAGGKGTRLHPITKSISKQILPVYDKPMIYYPLSILMLSNIKEILVISDIESLEDYKNLLGNGNDYGLHLNYAVQEEPKGIAESLIIAQDFLNGSPSALILGDNIFYGADLSKKLLKAASSKSGLTVFCFPVDDPHRFGIAEVNEREEVVSLEEKPSLPKSNLAVTGLYFYDSNASEYAREIKPSSRNELEITDLNKIYLEKKDINAELLLRGNSWFDTGTVDSLLEASMFIKGVQKNQGMQIGNIEEIAYNQEWINSSQLEVLIKSMGKNSYSSYLKELL